MALDRESCKRNAAVRAIEDFVKDDQAIGIGSGSTIHFAVTHLAKLVHERGLNVKCVPTSFQSRQLINQAGLDLTDLERHPELDFAIDGADEVDSNLNLVKGGGACLTQEKVVASSARAFLIIGDWTKKSDNLCSRWKSGIPIEVIPMSYVPVKRQIERHFGGVAEVRLGLNKAGPLITDNGNFVLDWKADFQQLQCCRPNWTWSSLHYDIKLLPGVVETGLCIDMATHIYLGMADGAVSVLDRSSSKQLCSSSIVNPSNSLQSESN